MEFTSKQKRQRILLEIRDILAGAAFPMMLQLILSTSIILFADYGKDTAVRAFALAVGEIMLIVAYIIFGRQNGVSAYRKSVVMQKKRDLQVKDVQVYYKTGEYAVWKGAVIGAVTVIPFVIFQFIQCLAPNTVCEFMLKYAFGWAAYPFEVFGVDTEWLNFIWVIIPIGSHLGAYLFGGSKERKRQQLVAEAQEIKDKKRR